MVRGCYRMDTVISGKHIGLEIEMILVLYCSNSVIGWSYDYDCIKCSKIRAVVTIRFFSLSAPVGFGWGKEFPVSVCLGAIIPALGSWWMVHRQQITSGLVEWQGYTALCGRQDLSDLWGFYNVDIVADDPTVPFLEFTERKTLTL